MKYTQGKEHEWIESYFGSNTGTFACIGSNDGVTFSNVYELVLKKWQGLCVEPSAEAFRRLSLNYAGYPVKLFNSAATGIYEGTVKMYESGEHIGNGDVSLLSTLHKDELSRWYGSANTFTETDVDAMPINSILNEAGFKVIDFFSIDCEGSEIDILKQIDFKKYKTKAVCVEWNSINKYLYDDILEPQGFTVINFNAENLFYGTFG